MFYKLERLILYKQNKRKIKYRIFSIKRPRRLFKTWPQGPGVSLKPAFNRGPAFINEAKFSSFLGWCTLFYILWDPCAVFQGGTISSLDPTWQNVPLSHTYGITYGITYGSCILWSVFMVIYANRTKRLKFKNDNIANVLYVCMQYTVQYVSYM